MASNWFLGNNQKSKKLTPQERKAKIEQKRLAKKQRIKDMFDSEYDRQTHGDGEENFFDGRKSKLRAQAEVCVVAFVFYLYLGD